MTATEISSDEGNHSDYFYRDGPDENERNRKRRRPQHESLGSSSPLTSRKNPPTRQAVQVCCRGRDRPRKSCSSPLFWWVALAFACCQNYQCSISSVLATGLREKTKHQTVTMKEQQRRFLQNGVNSASLSAASINYLELPTSLWTSKTARDEYSEGNEIRVSPFDKDFLYAINRAGDLRVISAVNGRSIHTVSPDPRTLTEDGTTSTWSLYSNSGMSFGSLPGTSKSEQSATEGNTESNGGVYNDYLQFLVNNGIEQNQNKDEEATRKQDHFAVYSIVDVAPGEARFLPKTRVVCVSIPEHKVLWTSAGLPGTPNGAPVVYYADEATMKGSDNDGAYVVLSHNSVLRRPNNQTQTTGHLTVLDPMNGHVKWTQSEWSRDAIPKGYGPPQVSNRPVMGGGNTGGSPANKNDFIIWTSSEDKGRGSSGILFSFQMKSSSELEAENQNSTSSVPSDPFEIRVLKKVRWNSITRPAMNHDGTILFIAVTGNAVRGWNGIARFDETANWSNQLVPLEGSVPTGFQAEPKDVAIPTAPVLSMDEERVFAVTVRNETVCLDAKTGVRKWAAKTRNSSPILSEPKASPDNQRLYVVNSRDGMMHGIDQNDGKVLWSFGCDVKNLPSGGNCQAPQVYANFALSYDGTVLYYGTMDGTIAALTLGNLEKEEPPPSISTTVNIDFGDDERGPIEFDKKKNVDSAQASIDTNQNVGLKIAGIMVGIIVSLTVAMASVLYIVRSKGIALGDLRNYRLPRYGSSKDDKRHSYVTRLDGPGNNFEDQIIARMSADEESIEEQFNTLWVDPTHSNPKYYHNDSDDESPTEDRLSVLLETTSDRVAPISDNFGFGQAVLI